MASDGLNEIGKYLNRNRKDTDHVLKRTTHIYPSIERARDIFDPDLPFEMTFETDDRTTRVVLDVSFNKPPPLIDLIDCCDGVLDDFGNREISDGFGSTEPLPTFTWETFGNAKVSGGAGTLYPSGSNDTSDIGITLPDFILPIEAHIRFRTNTNSSDIPAIGSTNSIYLAVMKFQDIQTITRETSTEYGVVQQIFRQNTVQFRQNWDSGVGYSTLVQISSSSASALVTAPLAIQSNTWYEAKMRLEQGQPVQYKLWISGQSEPSYISSSVMTDSMYVVGSFDSFAGNPAGGTVDVIQDIDFITISQDCLGRSSLLLDDFNRTTNPNSWGASSDGHVWIDPDTTPVPYLNGIYTDGTNGILYMPDSTGLLQDVYGAGPWSMGLDFTMRARITLTYTLIPFGTSSIFGVERLFRFNLSTLFGRAMLEFYPRFDDAYIDIKVRGFNCTSCSPLFVENVRPIGDGPYSGVPLQVIWEHKPSQYFSRAKAWRDGIESEPVGWTVSRSTFFDNYFTATDGFGVEAFNESATNNTGGARNVDFTVAIDSISFDETRGTGSDNCNKDGEKVYPEDCKVFIDDEDITNWAFGSETVTPDDVSKIWNNIDISQYVKSPGKHKIRIESGSGVGRVEARVKIS